MEQEFPLEIPVEVWNQIKYLCRNIWEVEWSGVLFYDTIGEFGNKNFKCIAKYILPMDKGTQAYTEFETGTEIVDFLCDNPDYMNFKQGLIHSHNNMNTFFSGTDLNEIAGNAIHHNYYLSLIVNNKGECCAKIASKGVLNEEKVRNFTYTSENGKFKNGKSVTKEKKDVVFLYDCDINTTELKVDEYFTKRVVEICKPKTVVRPTYSYVDKSSRQPWQQEELFPPNNSFFEEQPSSFNGFTAKNCVRIGLNEREAIIASFLNTWIPGVKEDFQDSLHELKRDFRKMKEEESTVQLEIFEEQMTECFEDCYTDFFDDPKMEDIIETLQECADLLDKFVYNNEVADSLHTIVVELKEEKEELLTVEKA